MLQLEEGYVEIILIKAIIVKTVVMETVKFSNERHYRKTPQLHFVNNQICWL